MKKIVFPLLSLALTLLVIATGMEIYARTVADTGMQFDFEMWKYARDVKQVAENSDIGHEHRPGATAHLMGVDVSINSKKLRDFEYSYEPEPGVSRILMLGDSLLFGWGVAFEETWSKRLELAFAADRITAEVINTGVGNYNTIQEVEYFLIEGYRYRPNVVVLNYFINDAEPVPVYSSLNMFKKFSYAYVYFKGRLDILSRQMSRNKDWASYYLGLYDEANGGWKAARHRIDRLAAYCRENGIELLIVHHPELRNLKSYRFGKVEALIREAAESNGAEYIDLTATLAREDESSLWVTRPDPHPNGRANEIIAAVLYPKLRALLDH